MNLFKLVGSIFIDNDEANKSISKTDSQAESLAGKFVKGATTAVKWGAAIGAGAIAGATALTAMASKSAAVSDNVDKMSQKIGISRQTYQELDFICSQCGASVDNLKAGMKTLTNQMQMAEEGSSTATAAFDALGLSWTDGAGKLKDQETMMWEALTALQACENQTEKAALATDLFGKAGTELMPMLNGSAGSIEEMKQKAHELGLVLDDETIDAGVVFTDTMDQAKRSLSTIVTKVGAEVMPVIQSGLDFIVEHMPEIQSAIETAFDAAGEAISFVVDGFKSLATWVNENEGKLKALAVVVGVLTTAIIAYNAAQAIKNAGGIVELAQLALLQVQIIGLTAAETAHTVATTIATGATTAFGAAVAFLTSPITLVVAAIGALIAIGVLLYKNWDTIKEKATELWENATQKFENIKNSASKKVEEMKTAIKNKFQDIVNSGKEKFESLKSAAVNKFDAIKNGIKNKLESARDVVKNIIEKIKGFFRFTVSLPKIKLPHFTIRPTGWDIGDLLKGSIPKLGISWYRKAMDEPYMFTKPTVFDVNPLTGQAKGAGEAGDEVMIGKETMLNMIRQAVAMENTALLEKFDRLLNLLSQFFPQVLAMMDKNIILDDGTLVGRLAPKFDDELGRILNHKGRGN